MKKKNTRPFILLCAFVLPLCALSITSCRQPSASSGSGKDGAGSSFRKKPQINHAVPQNPYELTESDVLEAFGLTKGKQSPFEAAEKIASGNSVLPSVVFTEKDVTAYDDEAGTFTAKVKGIKNGKEFEKEMTVSGFTNPYTFDPQSIYTADDKGELKFDEGIEHNHSIEKYIEKANTNIADFFKEPLTVLLASGTSVTLGNFHDCYTLSATLERAEGTDKIKIVPVYTVKNHKKAAGGPDTVTPEIKYSSFTHLKTQLTKDYFTEEKVFQYVLEQTVNDNAIKADPNEFASSFYAFAKETEKVPDNLFSEEFKTKVKKYTDLYQNKDTDEYLKLDITYGVYNPANGGVDADDYTGTVTAAICIATSEQLADKRGITAFKTVTKSGFASIPDDAALAKKKHLFFNLMVSSPSMLTQVHKDRWKKKTLNNHPLFSVDDEGSYTNKQDRIKINNPFKAETNPFLLSVNGSLRDVSTHLGHGRHGASITLNGKEILIKSIRIDKKNGSKSMDVYVMLKGSGSELKVTVEPDY